jgi:hypothetical protein
MEGQGKVGIGWMDGAREGGNHTHTHTYNLPWCLSSFKSNYIILRNVEIFEKNKLSKNKKLVKETRESLSIFESI